MIATGLFPMSSKAKLPTVGASPSKVTEASEVADRNAEPPIKVTLAGMVTEVSELAPANARSAIEVTLLGMVTDVRNLAPANAA